MSNCLSHSNEVCSHGSPPRDGRARRVGRCCVAPGSSAHQAPPKKQRGACTQHWYISRASCTKTAQRLLCRSRASLPVKSWRGSPWHSHARRGTDRAPPCPQEILLGVRGLNSSCTAERALLTNRNTLTGRLQGATRSLPEQTWFSTRALRQQRVPSPAATARARSGCPDASLLVKETETELDERCFLLFLPVFTTAFANRLLPVSMDFSSIC